MLYFMQMNKQTLIDIYEKDGLEGLVKYGAVAIHRAVTGPSFEKSFLEVKKGSNLQARFYVSAS